MRLVHLSDLHLGFRQFQRSTPGGINQREADVAKSFTNAIDKIIALRPDLVLIAGDVFHTVRPTNPAILHAFTQFSRLMRELPEAIVVIAAGNHDLPRSSETTCILRLFTPLGIEVADSEMRPLKFADRDLTIVACPDLIAQNTAIEPDPTSKYNVLVAHGEVEGTGPAPHMGTVDDAPFHIPKSVVESPAWNYVALGHYHVYQRVGPNAYYSGATDYASSNVWGELADQRSQKLPGKGLIERDLETGKQTFHPLPVVREFLDLPPVEGRGLSAADLDAAVLAAVQRIPGGIDGKVVRLVARDVPRHVVRELDHKALRDLQRRALHFHLDTRRPEVIRAERSGAPGRRPSLADTLRESLRSRVLTSDIDRERLIELGMKYLTDAEAAGALQGASAPMDES
jgi:DNA repair exonuclease SbcCD nuclease subunit